MNFSKKLLLNYFLVIFSPIVGVIFSFLKMDRKHQGNYIFLISFFSAALMTSLPPYQDFYRRFYETYNAYGASTTYAQAISGHVDILYYVLALTIKKLGLPFFYAPVFIVFLTVFNHLTALKIALRNKDHLNENVIRNSYFIYFCFINILVVGLGLRMGWAVSLASLSISSLFFDSKNKNVKFLLLGILSVLTHFSMLIVILVAVSSQFIKLNRKLVPLMILMSFSFGKILIPWLLGNFSLGGLSQYALNGYINNDTFADRSTNANEIIVNTYNYVVISIIIFYSFFNEDKNNVTLNKYSNFVSVYLCICFLFSGFYIAFNRYLVESGIFFYIILYLMSPSNKFIIIKKLILIIAVFNLVFSNIYLQRRPILLGEMWNSAILSPLLFITKSESDFEYKLKFINDEGDWIGHELGK